ncbi:MAG TPA: low molecular weight phosphotyrosine protein phosphatase, partial [Solirubrobacteraceae bacterium]
ARASAAALARGIELGGSARQARAADFEEFDLLLAMDEDNVRDLLAIAPDEDGAAKVRLLREFDPAAVAAASLSVPDPYHGGERGFEDVLDLVQAACEGLLADIRVRAER